MAILSTFLSLTTLLLDSGIALSIPNTTPDIVAEVKKPSHTLYLTRVINGAGKTSSRALRQSLLTGQGDITSAMLGQDFLANVTFGTDSRIAIIDTGSSDTWLVESGYTCVDYATNATIPEAQCGFGAPVPRSSSFSQIADENFNISYADGEYLNGIVGIDTVQFAGIQVPKQEVALAYLAGWYGDGISSGLLGLAFPSITSAFAGTDPHKDAEPTNNHPNTVSTQRPYSSLMNTIFFVQNLTDPVFSLALSRDGSGKTTGYGGLIEIGGVPALQQPVINASTAFTNTSIQLLQRQWINPGSPAYQFYAIGVNGIAYSRSRTPTTSTQYIVDSGTTLLYLPSTEAAAINALFVPPARNENGTYIIQCTARAPQIGVNINGTTFLINPSDLIYKINTTGTTCQSGVQDGGTGPYILGDVFLVNVLAVFNLKSYQMQFSSRQYYT